MEIRIKENGMETENGKIHTKEKAKSSGSEPHARCRVGSPESTIECRGGGGERKAKMLNKFSHFIGFFIEGAHNTSSQAWQHTIALRGRFLEAPRLAKSPKTESRSAEWIMFMLSADAFPPWPPPRSEPIPNHHLHAIIVATKLV
jgi:hypothetical protein